METAARLKLPVVPVWTLLLCGAGLVVFFAPALQTALIYDRTAISHGEVWRLVTGHLVHYSPSHVVYDVLALLVAGSIIEVRRYPHFAIFCAAAALLIGALLFLALPEMQHYAGLSGLATGALVYLCLHALDEASPWRRVCLAILAVLAVKLALEIVFGQSLTTLAAETRFVPVPLSHGAGAVTAFLVFLVAKRARFPGNRSG